MNDNVIETVRQRVDIVELVGEQARLQKSGRRFKANCPFHGEKTPSFYVDPERQTWHCFGACATGGDVFSYVMKRDNAEFRDALRTLADRAGVTLETGRQIEQGSSRDRLLAANEAAIAFFRQALTGSKAGSEARAYVGRRGLDDATVASFELGYAPDGWEYLRTYLTGRDFSDAELLEAGLLTAGESGSTYDRFRRRLIFPIRDDRGRAVGFGGRALDDAKPKYLNTPQTPLFDKSNVLYLLDRAKESIRAAKDAVVVEGYLDAITAHQFGYTNVVATLGTALTDRHVQLLKRLTPSVTLAMDSDAAGLEAASRGEEVTRTLADGERSEAVVSWDGLVRTQARAPVAIKVFSVPSGKDPDEAIREDHTGWPSWVQGAMPPFDFRLRLESERTDLSDPRARVELADRMLPLLLQIGDQALQGTYVGRLAKLAAVNEDMLASRLRNLAPRKALGQRVPLVERAAQPSSPPALPLAGREEKVEAFMLALLLRHPALLEAGEAIEPGIFQRSTYRQLFIEWLRSASTLDEQLTPEMRPVYATLMELRLPPYNAPAAEKALIDAVQKLRHRQIEEQKRLLTAELSEIQSSVDQGAAAGLSLAMQRSSDDAPLDGASEPVIAVASHLQEDEYLMRELHALEREQRTHRVSRLAPSSETAGAGAPAAPDAGAE